MKNLVQLCTYADRLGCGTFADLTQLLTGKLQGVFGGVHILPFYYPIDGADAGFDPIDHTKVDERLGDWTDVAALAKSHELMVDVIVNHMSSRSAEFIDYKAHGDASSYASLFLTFDKVFSRGATESDLVNLYRPRPGLPFSKIRFDDGKERLCWTTFTSDQIDIDVFSDAGQDYLGRILDRLAAANVKMIRLDAAGYAVKKAGSRCFMTEETFAFIEAFAQKAGARGMDVLVEIHAHFLTQVAIAKKADWVYDFALPPLVLHTLIAGDSQPLQNWLEISPRNAITVLDTHDGIGIIDIAADKQVGAGLLSDEQVDALVENIHANSEHRSRKATGAAASNVDLYQINCTFFEALGSNENKYLLARLIQFFAPGIPQVYYVGLFAGENDMALLERTAVGRDINRHYYSQADIAAGLETTVVKHLLALIRFRNLHPAFQTGRFECIGTNAQLLSLAWRAASSHLILEINLQSYSFHLLAESEGEIQTLDQWRDFDSWVFAHTETQP
ncbi:sucrose phosphorylase [Teredinibacter turnerae]|uniref:sucrose phosphorylase n=1 Tax=Teredinibacter turnerae TaxID=2426 RepID=UPI000373DE62|nr:sucrose phosphorylase [Teredinibacter turnerae]